MPMCLTLGVTILDSTTDILRVLYLQYTVGAPVLIAKASMYFNIGVVLLIAFCMHLIYSSVELEARAG